MALTGLKNLGTPVKPAANTDTTLITVATGHEQVAQVSICNQAGTDTTYRLAIRPGGVTLTTAHYVAYDVALPANSTDFVAGLALAAGDIVVVRSGSGSVSFMATGQDNS